MHYTTVNDNNIAYEDIGKGETVIFIHPPGMGRMTFELQRLLANDLRLILPDLSGHGDSRKSTHGYTGISDYADEIESIRKSMGVEKVFLFGYSAGGTVAQEYAFKYLDHVKGIMLSGAYPKVETEMFKAEHYIGIFLAGHFPKFLAKMLAGSHFQSHIFQKKLYQHILKADNQNWADFYRASLAFSFEEKLLKLNVPMLLLYGCKSDYINHHVKYYKKYIDTEVHMIPKASHQLPTRHSDLINAYILEFVNRHADQ
ncbi:alpha/beta fold hydrolase [Falsibacillus albus]|uniref:Alpha/beta hydrolase n=1 Tax=Falsibacillus albus TaxID=2478915 RepID=A0A3L7K3S5_9BACI|nr:alpha/beta hydrolase [Falsibacillus albus]RLQ95362.1 alpha/beta hydrolase [Falsibacillus albus]